MLFLICIIVTTKSISQPLFNQIYDDSLISISYSMLYETNDYYIAIGDYQGSGFGIGISASKHDKGTGKLLGRAGFAYDGQWTHVCGRTRIYDTGHAVHFVVSSHKYAYQLAYDYDDDTMTLIDTISQSGISSAYILDFELFPDSVIYYGRFNDTLGWLTKYSDQSTKLVHWKPKNNNYYYYDFIYGDNGSRIFFCSERLGPPYSSKIIVAEVDAEGNFIWERRNMFENALSVRKILPINNDEVLMLLSARALDEKFGGGGFFDQVVKFDLKSKTFSNPKYYAEVTSTRPYGDLIASSQDTGTYFVCTMSYWDFTDKTSTTTCGRIVKIDSELNELWHKDYIYYPDNGKTYNEFNTIIPVVGGHYLIGGYSNWYGVGWLIKIDEDGNIVPIDTTTSSVDIDMGGLLPEITIYPNPSAGMIIINQGDTRGMRYQLSDLRGHAVKALDVPTSNINTIWDISDIPAGSYVLTIMQDGKIIKSKLQIVIK